VQTDLNAEVDDERAKLRVQRRDARAGAAFFKLEDFIRGQPSLLLARVRLRARVQVRQHRRERNPRRKRRPDQQQRVVGLLERAATERRVEVALA
jgi:hypothetical protein